MELKKVLAKIKSIDIDTLTNVEFTEDPDGSGTIRLGPKNPNNNTPEGMDWLPGAQPTPSLSMIKDVRIRRRIIDLVRSLSDNKDYSVTNK